MTTITLGLRRGAVSLAKYEPAWAEAFAVEAVTMRLLAGEYIRQVHHFGSTAIPGATAKPIIDIAAIVPEPSLSPALLRRLRNLGYGLDWVHVLPDRVCLTKGNPVTHHLYLVNEPSETLLAWIAFRDALRASETLREEYDSLKRELALRHPNNRMAYTSGKTAFIHHILEITK